MQRYKLSSRNAIAFEHEVKLPIFYEGVELKTTYKVNFICFDEVVVELKALARLASTEEAQVINYLKATGLETGLLLNFGTRSLDYRRFVLTKSA
jgi:GxxExxY protein